MNTNMIISIVYMVALFAIFYFLFIRPQRKKEKQLEELRSSLEVGQMVTTIGGMLATVAKVEEEFVVLEVGPNRNKMPFKIGFINFLDISSPINIFSLYLK